MAIKCGNCKQYHDTVDDVKGCHIRAGIITYRAAAGLPNSYTDGDPSSDEGAWPGDRDEARRVNPYGINAVQESGEGFLTGKKPQKVYLNVPYAEKDRAKHEFDAKFDWTEKRWYVFEDADFDSMPDEWYLASQSDSALADRHAASKDTRPFNPINEDGIYVVNPRYQDVLGAEYIKVQMNREGTRLYAKRLVELFPAELKLEANPKNAIELWAANNGMKKPVEWTYQAGLLRNMARHMVTKLGVEDAAQFGHLYGICMECGAILTNEESIARGMGPICAGKW
ncbi:hypothetical protein SEA_LUCKYLEO_48 [Gordonia phage LuckyLeo]|nr:hypothetical protein SEA_LUCKYLEO_48 [Gordonia phage LuckyLeo]